jgi:predicted ATPase
VTAPESRFFFAGGALRPDAPSYVERQADHALYEALQRSEFCYVLTSRQMGKSSLMVRTAARLRDQGVQTAILDLTTFGQNVSAEQWYFSLLLRLGEFLGLDLELHQFWSEQERLGPLRRFMAAIEHVLLGGVRPSAGVRSEPAGSEGLDPHGGGAPGAEGRTSPPPSLAQVTGEGRLVVFIDEIDIVRSLPFSTDEFFAAIRECYNRRAQDPEFKRLTFCLMGVATPAELIQDSRSTPFNIGRRIELTDFTSTEAAPLAAGLRPDQRIAATLLEHILNWTGGHPYLTQRLCQAVAEDGSVSVHAGVDRLCQELFFSSRARQRDDNLAFVRERLLRSGAGYLPGGEVLTPLLELYAKVWTGWRVPDDPDSPLVGLLRITGIVRAERGGLEVRNRIYAQVFDREWVTTQLPDAEVRRQRTASRQEALRSASPYGRGPLIGREQEVEALRRRLLREDVGPLTLTGVGGCGKTRLALEVAAQLVDEFEGGALFVDLAPVSDPRLVLSAIARSLDLHEEAGRTLLDSLKDRLRDRNLMLLLDNFEQVVEAAPIVGELLTASSQLKVLVTSRTALRIQGEQEFRVPPLSLPDLNCLPPVEDLTQYAAVELFIQRTRSVRPAFTTTNQNARAVAEICVRLDGIPLAIELAAARVKALSVEKIAERLDDRFRLLTGGSRTALPRQQTVRATIDWSYDLLSEPERALLRRLSVSAGGWTLEAAEAVAGGADIEEGEVLDLLAALVEKSLALYEDEQQRYRLLETVRQYASERLMELEESGTARERHLGYYLSLVPDAASHWGERGQRAWVQRLEAEHDNLRTALEWSLTTAWEREAGLRLAAAMGEFCLAGDYLGEGREWLERMLKESRSASPALRALALEEAGWLALRQGDSPAAQTFGEESLTIRRMLGNEGETSRSLDLLGGVALSAPDYPRARHLFGESLAIARATGRDLDALDALLDLGKLALIEGNLAEARSLFETILGTQRELGDLHGVAYSLHSLGCVLRFEAQYAAARARYEESLRVGREIGFQRIVASALFDLGLLALREGDPMAAQTFIKESLA